MAMCTKYVLFVMALSQAAGLNVGSVEEVAKNHAVTEKKGDAGVHGLQNGGNSCFVDAFKVYSAALSTHTAEYKAKCLCEKGQKMGKCLRRAYSVYSKAYASEKATRKAEKLCVGYPVAPIGKCLRKSFHVYRKVFDAYTAQKKAEYLCKQHPNREVSPPAPADTLYPGQTLEAGGKLVSSGGHVTLEMQSHDGNLVLYKGRNALWSATTAGHPGAYLSFQRDGNLVVYSHDGAPLWAVAKGEVLHYFSGAAKVVLQDDGNLVMKDVSGAVLWASRELYPATFLQAGGRIVSRGGHVTLDMQSSDGNLVLYKDRHPIWSAPNTGGHPGAYLTFQKDGNLVVYSHDGAVLWAAVKGENLHEFRGAAKVVLQDNGNLVMKDVNGAVLWASGIGHHYHTVIV